MTRVWLVVQVVPEGEWYSNGVDSAFFRGLTRIGGRPERPSVILSLRQGSCRSEELTSQAGVRYHGRFRKWKYSMYEQGFNAQPHWTIIGGELHTRKSTAGKDLPACPN